MSSVEIISEPKFIDFKVYGDARTLVALTFSTWSSKPATLAAREMTEVEFLDKYQKMCDAIEQGYSSILEMCPVRTDVVLPRYGTLALTSYMPGADFLQQSFRYTKPEIKTSKEKTALIFVPKTLARYKSKIIKQHERALALYDDIAKKVETLETRKPIEEARYHLGLNTGTFISALLNLSHIADMVAHVRMYDAPTIWKQFVFETLDRLREHDRYLALLVENVGLKLSKGKYYPTPYPFVSSDPALRELQKFENNGRNEIALLGYDVGIIKRMTPEQRIETVRKGIKEGKFPDFAHAHFTFATKESYVTRMENVRHRTNLQSVTSLIDSAKRREIMITSALAKLPTELLQSYSAYIDDSFSLYDVMSKTSEQDAIGALTHNLMGGTMITIDGHNAFDVRAYMGNRCCELAQTETQNVANMINVKINTVLKDEGLEELQKITGANCFKLRKCPELPSRSENCTIFKARSFERELFPVAR